MRRIFLIAVVLAAAAAGLVSSAFGDGQHRYTVELDNAFGLADGSDVRIAGVTTGSVTHLEVSRRKTALVTIETSGPLAVLGTETHCSAQPQALISEYFLDCQPHGPPLPDGGEIPVSQTTQTVQPDLLLNTLREPFEARLRLLINEFGTSVAGNSSALNDAIRRGAPALRNLRRALSVVADQRRAIRNLSSDADQILVQLAERRGDVAGFIRSAQATTAATASRRSDLQTDFRLLDDGLGELRPTLSELGNVAGAGTPLLANLRASSGNLNVLAKRLPPFADSASAAVEGLRGAAAVGRSALTEGADEIYQLRVGAEHVPGASKSLDDLLADISDPRRVVEHDARAARSCDDPTRPCWSTGRRAPTGYTALEGALNFVYYLTGATNQYDALGHMLHFSVYDVGTGPCGLPMTGGKPGTSSFGVPRKGGGLTTSILDTADCVSWLGPNQPRINQPVDLPRYDGSVCPGGSNAPELCDPGISAPAAERRSDQTQRGAPSPGPPGQAPGKPSLPPLRPGPSVPQLPQIPQIPGLPEGPVSPSGGLPLLDFLLGS